MTTNKKILTYIKKHWKDTIREEPVDKGDLIGLPYPYTVPCIKANFQEMYYWDTYFTSLGLLKQGFPEQVKHNCNNFIYLIERFGFIPNGTRTRYLSRSQLPYFGSLVEIVYEIDHNRTWLKRAVSALEKEMEFWMNNRLSPNGLNRQGYDIPDNPISRDNLIKIYDNLCVKRLHMDKDAPEEFKVRQSAHTIAEAECWDFTPRFKQRCMNFNPVDLNSILYRNEILLAQFHEELGCKTKAGMWKKKSEIRKFLINTYCWNEKRGVFLDYDFVNEKQSSVFSAASLQPMWAGITTIVQAEKTVLALEKYLEFEYGLSTCEKNDSDTIYQWDYPNGWPPIQIIAINTLDKYGYIKQARRLAQKYISTVAKCFEQTGELWEKYNVFNGSTEVKDEYKMPTMMGWTAAAFVLACEYLKKDIHWYDTSKLTVEGRGWNKTESIYDRLPLKAKGIVRDVVWNLSKYSAGISIHFTTNAPSLAVKWDGFHTMTHMAPTGVSGLDLYVRHNGKWRWLSVGRPSRELNETQLFTNLSREFRDYILYLPLYNSVNQILLGIQGQFELRGTSPRKKKPIVFYGTSITQGACASRPGMCYPAILGRWLDNPVINLGFSGNGIMEPEIIDLLCELDPVAYILDNMPNMEKQIINEREESAIIKLTKAHPTTPIVLIDNMQYCDAFLNSASMDRCSSSNRAQYTIYQKLLKKGYNNLHYIKDTGLIGFDGEATVDGTHFTDLGYMRFSEKLIGILREIINNYLPQ